MDTTHVAKLLAARNEAFNTYDRLAARAAAIHAARGRGSPLYATAVALVDAARVRFLEADAAWHAALLEEPASLVRCAVCLGAQRLDVDGAGREVECWGCNGEGVVEAEAPECKGHPAGPHDAMGSTVYCDGSCRKVRRAS